MLLRWKTLASYFPVKIDLDRLCLFFLAAVSLSVLGLSTMSKVDSWNAGSRLASVEALVDQGTWQIDRSIFAGPDGTKDKLWIEDHFYSDKSPVPSLWLAAVYWCLQQISGMAAAKTPGQFAYWMSLSSTGLAYLVAVLGMYFLCRRIGLSPMWSSLFGISLALGSVALPYAQQVNNHQMVLGITVALLLALPWKHADARRFSWRRWVLIGTLTGIAYTIDLGAGPGLVLAMGIYLCWRIASWRCLALVGVAALPWLLLHHALNYAIGGTLGPANANPDYLAWPGSPFTASNMTGGWQHPGVGAWVVYALDLLFGQRGFIGHNPLLYIGVFGFPLLIWVRHPLQALLWLCAGMAAGVWLIYSLLSTNWSGACCSIRWFVPLLGPGYVVAAAFTRRFPNLRWAVAVFLVWGMLLGLVMAWVGPWTLKLVPGYWFFQGGILVSWLIGVGYWRRRSARLQSRHEREQTSPPRGYGGSRHDLRRDLSTRL